MSAKRGELPILQVDPPKVATRSRDSLVARARRLAWIGLGWHAVEAVVAIGAGVIPGSVALVGFGADSLIELAAGLVVLWRLASARAITERRAQQMIAVSFYLLSVYVAVEATGSLASGSHPAVSWVGIGLSVVTLATMPVLANAKAKVADQLGSSATKSESRQTMLCAYLSAGPARWARLECAVRVVVGRSRDSARHRARRSERGSECLAGGGLLHYAHRCR